MIIIQLLTSVPRWARKRGLDEKSFNILEQVALMPEKQELILKELDDGTRCCILQALSYAKDKGLV